MDDDVPNLEPATFWINVIAWICCSGVWGMAVTWGTWWVIIPSMGLISFSFTLAIVKDLRTMRF